MGSNLTKVMPTLMHPRSFLRFLSIAANVVYILAALY